MIDKSLIIILIMYVITISLMTFEYTWAAPYGLSLTNFQGEAITPVLESTLPQDRLNQIQTDVLTTNINATVGGEPFDRVGDFNLGMAYTAWEYISLLSGTYMFYILYFMGVPLPLVIGMSLIYGFFFIRTVVGILRGI